MTYILILSILSSALFGVGLYNILCSVFSLSGIQQESSVRSIFRRKRAKTEKSLQSRLTDLLAAKMRLPKALKNTIEDALVSVGKTETSEHFVSGLIVRSSPLVICSLLLLPVSGVFSAIVFLSSFIIPVMGIEEIKKKTVKKRNNIDSELLGFVLYIEKCIRHSRDVIYICESFVSGDPDFSRELSITSRDMRTSSVDSALSRLEKRVGSALLSDVTRGLGSVQRGDETIGYWQSLELKLRENERMVLRKKANKLPSKTRSLSLVMLLCFVSIYAVVLGTIVVESLSILL